ncbi:hypothetical protein AB6A40_003420 [Gnathostoma spinigerum]|uniref:PDZ domain-containing protein n=1 Tax=Gnathostoma spinigerum TaxID=75299 RepID=A0ABD6EBZ3_9BILA
MKDPRTTNLDVVHHGMVMLSDGKGRRRQARMELTRDLLTIQVIINAGEEVDSYECGNERDNTLRTVKLRKTKEGGLGISIKGGSDGNEQIPVVISKIFPDMPAEASKLLYVGDAIIEVNGQSVAGKTHDDVVQMLRDAGDEVTLSVRHYTQITAYLRPSLSLNLGKSVGALDRVHESHSYKSSLKAHSETFFTGKMSRQQSDDSGSRRDEDASTSWKTIVKIPLPMAFLTRYLWGTDKVRSNAFEVRAVDGTSSGIIHCEDKNSLDEWIKHILRHISSLNYKSVRISNKYLHKNEQINYIGWVCEYMPEDYFDDPKLRWEPRFLVFKGGDICVFETPPLSSDDLDKCVSLYKIYDTALKLPEDGRPKVDRRQHCFWIETAIPGVEHYFSTETSHQFKQFENAYYRCVYNTITSLQTKTFACSYEGRPSGLVFDINQGISLYDIPTKRYIWQYRFYDLDSSADDGKIRLVLSFRDERSTDNGVEVKNIESDEILPIVFTMHAFYVTKVIATEPDYLKTIPLI